MAAHFGAPHCTCPKSTGFCARSLAPIIPTVPPQKLHERSDIPRHSDGNDLTEVGLSYLTL